jgi:phosphatidate cytidylyltransferase
MAMNADEASAFKSNLAKRVTTALTVGTTTLLVIYLSPWGLLVLALTAATLGMREFFNMYNIKVLRWESLAAYGLVPFLWVVPVYLFGLKGVETLGFKPLLWYITLMPALGYMVMFLKKRDASFKVIIYIFFNLLYVHPPFILFYVLSFGEPSRPDYIPAIPLFILLLHWIADTAAFFGGKFLGRHKLWESISPQKTWEGFVLGILVTIGVGAGMQNALPIPGYDWRTVAFIVAFVGTFGDLMESALKRNQKLKDSGNVLPGHGGILDRFDGFLFVMPVLTVYRYFF